MSGRVLCLMTIVWSVTGLSAHAQSPTDRLDAAVHAEMERQGAIGVAVGWIRDGKVAGLKAYGLADREQNHPATTETVFNWASNSKPVAAVAAMQLVAAGKLELDAPIQKYLPDYPPTEQPLTMRRLLCHQSGLPHYENGRILPTLQSTPRPALAELDPVESLARFNRSPLIFVPGSKVSYSSYAYVLISAVIQAAGDEPYADQIDRRIVKPLGLTSFQLDLPTNGQRDWAIGYVRNAAGTVRPAEEEAHFWKHGAGGYKSNVADFARWAAGLVNHQLVPADIERQMWTRQPLQTGEPTTWGLGFTLDDRSGLVVSHNGSQAETKTRMVVDPANRRGVVVLCNCQFVDIAALTNVVERALQEP